MGELSLELSQTRLARGLSLEDAERSTRIAKKFLVALEEHNYTIFPAPVYARGFLRTYCRYLGLDPEQQLSELPLGWTGAGGGATTHLPSVSRPLTLNTAWLIGGVALAALLLAGYLLATGGSNLKDIQARIDAQSGQQPAGAQSPGDATATISDFAATPQGTLPDFAGHSVTDSLAFLTGRGITYLLIETADATHAEGTVISQSPLAGAPTSEGSIVTLAVSTGTQQSTTVRTDCGVLSGATTRSAAEQAWFSQNCGAAAPTILPDRTTCDQIRGTDYRSGTERAFFLKNCVTG